MSNHNWKIGSFAAVLVAATIGAGHPSAAAPVLTNTAAVKTAASNALVDVRYYGHGGAFVGGMVLGGLFGAAIARPYYYGYGNPYWGYGPYYGYSYPYWGYSPYYYGYPRYYPRYYYRHRYYRHHW